MSDRNPLEELIAWRDRVFPDAPQIVGPATVEVLNIIIRKFQKSAPVEPPVLSRAAEIVKKLKQWDMLTLTPQGFGAATADAPWAHDLLNELAAILESLSQEGGSDALLESAPVEGGQ